MKKQTILVTGGAGFIGSHVVDAYVRAGHRVVVVDDLSSGRRANVNPAADFRKLDIANMRAVRQLMDEVRPDILNHQAALVSVTQSTEKPLHTYEVNVMGTVNLLIAGLPYLEKVIFASTGGAMYAHPKKFPATEKEVPTPLSPYGFSKQLAEQAVAFYCTQQNVDYTILRYANVFGPRQNPHGESGVIAIFCALAAAQAQPTIYRKETTRDYVYVGDIAAANVAALTKGAGEIINIGTGKEVTNQAVYEAVREEFSWQRQPLYKSARPGELRRSVLANGKAKKLLGWRPRTSLREGLSLIHHFRA